MGEKEENEPRQANCFLGVYPRTAGATPHCQTTFARSSAAERRKVWDDLCVRSPQTLSEADRRVVSAWAADCAERVLGLFEAEAPGDSRPRDAIARARVFARGELGVAGEIRRRFVAGGSAREVSAPPAAAAARAAGQAAGIPHMGAHALGAAAYAAKAAGLAAPDRPEAVSEEIRWQLDRMSPAVRAALRQLPPVGENASGPLGPGLLATGLLGTIIRDLQASLADPEPARSRRS
jgi:immunity protein 5 of polymorphic toxin system